MPQYRREHRDSRTHQRRRVCGSKCVRDRNRKPSLNLDVRGKTALAPNAGLLLIEAKMFLALRTPQATTARPGLPPDADSRPDARLTSTPARLNNFADDLVACNQRGASFLDGSHPCEIATA